jgi:L-histidine N-alpha-methyltransferase
MQALINQHSALRFIPIDISRFALEESAKSLVEEFVGLEILAVAGDYTDGLDYLKQSAEDPRLILWLGSNIGNFERQDAAAFFHRVHDAMQPHDRFLVGIDLRKDRETLEAAYDDSRGVTARFNKNILKRVNAQLGGRFDLDRFRHLARYNDDLGRVEMHLVAETAHTVAIDALELQIEFAEGETIHTENSYKYSQQEIEEVTARSSFYLERQWFDAEHRFSLNLFCPR